MPEELTTDARTPVAPFDLTRITEETRGALYDVVVSLLFTPTPRRRAKPPRIRIPTGSPPAPRTKPAWSSSTPSIAGSLCDEPWKRISRGAAGGAVDDAEDRAGSGGAGAGGVTG